MTSYVAPANYKGLIPGPLPLSGQTTPCALSQEIRGTQMDGLDTFGKVDSSIPHRVRDSPQIYGAPYKAGEAQGRAATLEHDRVGDPWDPVGSK